MSEIYLEGVKCAVCGNTDHDKYRVKWEYVNFKMVECQECMFTFIPPYYRKDIDYEHYKDEAVLEQIRKGNNWLKIQRHFHKFQLIGKYKKSGKLFDIGAGWGHFLLAGREKGYEIYGVEPSQLNCVYSKGELGLPIDNISVFNLPEDNKYDVITLWDVLEHIDRADDVIEKCSKVINEDGYIFIQVPQLDSWYAKRFNEKWGAIHLDHVNYFTNDCMRRLLERYGFEIVDIKSSIELKNMVVSYLLPVLTGRKRENNVETITESDRQVYFNKITSKPKWMLRLIVWGHNLLSDFVTLFGLGEELIAIARMNKK
jgi:2-polyprenyl-3-methyl-5-hydroxy-6-metoxy-1,4-benzoquinol methylase